MCSTGASFLLPDQQAQACYGKKTAFVFDKPGVGYNCRALGALGMLLFLVSFLSKQW